MKNKVSCVLLIVGFLLIVFLPHIVWPTAQVYLGNENLENRKLASMPNLDIDSIETYPREFENYYNDHMPFRNQLVRLYNRTKYELFHESTNANVIIGKNDWLFYGNPGDGKPIACYDGSLLLTQEQLETIAHNLTEARDALAAQGTEFVLFIAPNKERVYSEYMPERYGQPAQQCMVNQVVSYLRSETDIRVIYAYDALMEYRETCDELELYYPMDTHWNTYGSYIGVRELLNELDIHIPALEQMETTREETGVGDLAVMLNIAGGIKRAEESKVHGYASADVVELENEFYGRIAYAVPELPERKLFVKRDSFCTMMIPYLKAFFSDSLFVHNQSYDAEQVWEYQPDVYVYETVERYIGNLQNPIL